MELVQQYRSNSLANGKENNHQVSNQLHLLRRPIKNIQKRLKEDSPQKIFKPTELSRTLDLKQQQTNMVFKDYGHDILMLLRRADDGISPRKTLQRHNIPTHMRAKMVDWMIEVMGSYKYSQNSFFTSVRLMDSYFGRVSKNLQLSELHLIGVAAMYTSCKFQEIYPFKLSTVHEKIAHRKLSKEQILAKEHDILSALNFEVLGTNHFELASLVLFVLAKERFGEKQTSYLNKVMLYLSKMVCYDLQILESFKLPKLAAGVIFVSFKIMEQIEKTFRAQSMCTQLSRRLDVEESEIVRCGGKILSLAKCFEKIHPTLENLRKFNGISLEVQKK